MTEIVEIRDYTIEQAWLEAYKEWAEQLAAPWLKKNLDVVDFWVDDGIEASVDGSDPKLSPHGQANVWWIIRWASKEERDIGFNAVLENPEWQEIWSKHPNENAYLVMNARFMKSVF